jgi:hypothetical protein
VDAERHQITTFSHRGVEYPVYVDSHGMFSATVEDHDLQSPDLSTLFRYAEAVPRRKVAVRFQQVHQSHPGGRLGHGRAGTVSRGTATGFHATNVTSLLVDWDGAPRRGTQTGSRMENTVQVTDADVAEIQQLLEAQHEANQAVARWIEAHQFDVHQAVRDALMASSREAQAAGE